MNTVILSAGLSGSDELNQLLNTIAQAVPATVEILPTLKLAVILVAVTLGFGILFRLFFGRSSSLNRAISSAIGILCMYALTVAIYTMNPWDLKQFLSPLPFALFRQDILILLPYHGAAFATVCSHILSMVILAFLVNLLDAIIPRGDNIAIWFILRFFSVVAAMFLNLASNWAFNTYLPGILVTYAPILLLGVLLVFLLLGMSKVILGLILAAVNPFIAALYTFFFSNMIGKQLAKAVLTTALLCTLFYFLEYYGYSVIFISSAALLSYIPMFAILLVLWYLVGHEL